MFSKVLIANRGEIAVRILRACKELGIRTVAIYSEADTDCLHLHLADEAVCVGPAVSAKSYLNVEAILDAARRTGVEAIHPGYGYLAERGDFAKACEADGLVFIGPTPENLELAGDKLVAKKTVEASGVPVIPSSPAGIGTPQEAESIARQIGYPVIIKASAGGGGRGMRICRDSRSLLEEFPVAKMEARAAFGNDEVYIEKFIQKPRHIEFQILVDRSGNAVHLGERECTIQRRYQKLIEESPSPRLTSEMRRSMGEAAITAVSAARYFNAGTVEFLVDEEGNYYFLEINARIQVEHPVTELVTGVDLVKEQIRLAWGDPLDPALEDIQVRGWAIECRINAEDPDRGFLPSPGTVDQYRPPGGFGVRLDTHLYQGYDLPIYYDSLVAKLLAYDRTRDGAIRIMRRALEEFTISPLKTTIPLHLRILQDPDFLQGRFTTDFIEKFYPDEEEEED